MHTTNIYQTYHRRTEMRRIIMRLVDLPGKDLPDRRPRPWVDVDVTFEGYANKPRTLEHLKQNIREESANISPKIFQKLKMLSKEHASVELKEEDIVLRRQCSLYACLG
nr:unnamed protein product [Callosobruchus chinensis]